MNRISAVTRWPLDPAARIERAETDLVFARVMFRLFGCDPKLTEITQRAFRIKVDAQDELLRPGAKPR